MRVVCECISFEREGDIGRVMASSTLTRGRRGKGSERSRASQMVAMFPCEQYGPLAHYPMLPFHGPVWPYWMSCYTGLAASSDSGGSAGQSVSGGTQEDVFALTNALDDAKEALRDSRSDVRDCQRRLQTALASIEQLGEEVKDLRNYQWRYKRSEEEISDLEFENTTVGRRTIVHPPHIPYIRVFLVRVYVRGARWEDAGFFTASTGCSS